MHTQCNIGCTHKIVCKRAIAQGKNTRINNSMNSKMYLILVVTKLCSFSFSIKGHHLKNNIIKKHLMWKSLQTYIVDIKTKSILFYWFLLFDLIIITRTCLENKVIIWPIQSRKVTVLSTFWLSLLSLFMDGCHWSWWLNIVVVPWSLLQIIKLNQTHIKSGPYTLMSRVQSMFKLTLTKFC